MWRSKLELLLIAVLLLTTLILQASCKSNGSILRSSVVKKTHKNKNNSNLAKVKEFNVNVRYEQRFRENSYNQPHLKSDDADIIATKQAIPIKNPWYMQFFPIYPKELPKFFSLSFMMFWIVFIFTMTRDTKDALIVPNCGAEAIAFLKVYGVVPAAAAFMMIYAKLANTFAPKTLFYITLAPFFLFYFVFAYILYPMRNALHPYHIPVPENGMKYPVNLLRHWTFSLYYIVSELWGSAGVPLLFWSCANDVVQVSEAKRIYPLMSLVGNLGPILSGITMTIVSRKISNRISNEEVAFEASLKVLTGIMMVAGTFIACLHYLIHRIRDAEKIKESASTKLPLSSSKKVKKKASLVESLKILGNSQYLQNVCTMVLSYGLTMEFTEIIWKASVKKAFPVKTDYLKFMGRYSTMVGSAAFMMMFVGAKIVETLGWRAGAVMTPLMMGLLAAPFFGSIILGGTSNKKLLMTAVYIGLLQNVFSKATKYAGIIYNLPLTFGMEITSTYQISS